MVDYTSLTVQSGIAAILLGAAVIVARLLDYDTGIVTAPEILIIGGFTAIGARRAAQKIEDRL